MCGTDEAANLIERGRQSLCRECKISVRDDARVRVALHLLVRERESLKGLGKRPYAGSECGLKSVVDTQKSFYSAAA